MAVIVTASFRSISGEEVTAGGLSVRRGRRNFRRGAPERFADLAGSGVTIFWAQPASTGERLMPHPDELPEGTDHIINGAMATDDDEGGTQDGGGFVGSAGGDDTGGT